MNAQQQKAKGQTWEPVVEEKQVGTSSYLN
jgi:hypothetical protein